MYSINTIRQEFPILASKVHGANLIYFDNAATTQKPLCVLDASRLYYEKINSNIHRGAHYLSQIATEAHEGARKTIATFLNASSPKELIFTSGCTMSINMVAQILSLSGTIQAGDEIIISTESHHSNIVPWQMLCERNQAQLKVIPLTDTLQLDIQAFKKLLSPKTRVVALPHVSNALGIINPIKDITAITKAHNPKTIVLIDGAQSISHLDVDVQEIGCDFFAFSGHKIYAPTGIGGLWGKQELLETLPPWLGGGEMIKDVTFEHTSYNSLPFKYEAGTPNIEGAIAMAEAINFISTIGLQNIEEHEHKITQLCLNGLKEIPQLEILGPDEPRSAIISFILKGVHHYDLGTLLDQMGIAVRTGHHCCQPLMQCLDISGTTRISFALYNTEQEVVIFVEALKKVISMLN